MIKQDILRHWADGTTMWRGHQLMHNCLCHNCICQTLLWLTCLVSSVRKIC